MQMYDRALDGAHTAAKLGKMIWDLSNHITEGIVKSAPADIDGQRRILVDFCREASI